MTLIQLVYAIFARLIKVEPNSLILEEELDPSYIPLHDTGEVGGARPGEESHIIWAISLKHGVTLLSGVSLCKMWSETHNMHCLPDPWQGMYDFTNNGEHFSQKGESFAELLQRVPDCDWAFILIHKGTRDKSYGWGKFSYQVYTTPHTTRLLTHLDLGDITHWQEWLESGSEIQKAPSLQ